MLADLPLYVKVFRKHPSQTGLPPDQLTEAPVLRRSQSPFHVTRNERTCLVGRIVIAHNSSPRGGGERDAQTI